MERGYGQFCTLARAADALCGRWTPLVLHQLLRGSKRFNDVHRGLPRMSSSLLAQRLRQLEQAGIVQRIQSGKVSEYHLTAAGEELRAIIDALGEWGARWGNAALSSDELDPGVLMWDIRRSLAHGTAIAAPALLQFSFLDAGIGERNWWIVLGTDCVDLLQRDPGGRRSVLVQGSVRALTEVWRGDRPVQQALSSAAIRIDGAGPVAERMGQWLGTFH